MFLPVRWTFFSHCGTDTFMHYEWIGLYEDPFYSFDDISLLDSSSSTRKRRSTKAKRNRMRGKKLLRIRKSTVRSKLLVRLPQFGHF